MSLSTSLTRRALLLAAALPLLAQSPAPARPDWQHLVVLHTNDIHGQVLPRLATWVRGVDPLPTSGGLARVAGYVNRVREEEGASNVLVVDAGDWFQGTPEGLIDEGLAFVKAMALVGYDAMAVGNHEFDHGVYVLLEHLAAARPPALLANARGDHEYLPGTRPYVIVERAGLRIALVGFCTTSTPEITHPSTRYLTWVPAEDALTGIKRELAGKVDWILPLTHIGVGGDHELARAHPDLDLIVGGHTHTFLKSGETEGCTLIVQMGSKASGVGRVDLWFDRSTKRVVRKEAQVVNLFEDAPAEYRNEALEAACERLVAISSKRMEEVVGTLAAPLARGRDPLVSSPCGNLVTDVMRARAKADVAITNRGGLRADLPAGPVTRRYLFEVLPFGNNLVTVTLSGAELEALMRRSVEGGGHSGLEFSGMTLEVRRTSEGARVARVLVGGEPADAGGRYRVATNSFLAQGGDAYAELAGATEREEDPILLRHLLEEAFDGGSLTPPRENRYVVVK